MDATQLNNLFTVNPTTVVTVRYGFNRFPNFDYNSSQGYQHRQSRFLPRLCELHQSRRGRIPAVICPVCIRLGDSGDWDYYDEASHNFSASVDKFIGRHSIRAGLITANWLRPAPGLTAPPAAIPSIPTPV